MTNFMCMNSGGIYVNPLSLLSKGEKNHDVQKGGEASAKFLRMCCQQFQRGRLLSRIARCMVRVIIGLSLLST